MMVIAINSTAWPIQRYSIWQAYHLLQIWICYQASVACSPAFIGLPLVPCLGIQALDMMVTFYVGGVFAPGSLVSIENAGFVSPATVYGEVLLGDSFRLV